MEAKTSSWIFPAAFAGNAVDKSSSVAGLTNSGLSTEIEDFDENEIIPT